MHERLYLKPQLRPCEITIQGKPETFTFLGFTHYCGKRRTDGIGYCDGPRLVYAARMRNGFTPSSCRWLQPSLVGQFEFVERTEDAHLRHKSIRRAARG